MLAASFLILTEILSGAVAFFGFKCLIILLILTVIPGYMVKEHINLILGWFSYVLIIYSTANLSLFSSYFSLS